MKRPVAPVASFVALAAAAVWSAARSPPAPLVDDEEAVAQEREAMDARVTGPSQPVPLPLLPASPPAEPESPEPGPDNSALESMVEHARWPRPRDEDLASAPGVTLAYNEAPSDDSGEAQARCAARALRGWLRVTCERFEASVSLLGGSAEGLVIDADMSTVTITLPLVPGDRRVLQIARLGFEYGQTTGLHADSILSEIRIGTEGPHVTIHPAVRAD